MSKNFLFKSWIPLLVLALALPLAACFRQAQLKNLVDQPVAGSRNQTLTSAQVKKVILDACQKRGWVARELSPGRISATLDNRSHRAQIEITFNGSRYSILYKDSLNLKYDPSNNTIHNQYNNWVDYLRQDIEIGLARV